MVKNYDNDFIVYFEKEGYYGIEIVLWEDKELFGIVFLKYLEILEIGMKLFVLVKSVYNVVEFVCVV